MRKYPWGEKIAGAIYDNVPIGNPFLAAMPEMMGRDEFLLEIQNKPKLPHGLPSMTPAERRQAISTLSSIFIPLDFMYAIFDQVYRAISSTYCDRSLQNCVRQTNALFCGSSASPLLSQAATGSILGVPGVGKTSTIRRCLSLIPQVIEHTECQGKPFFCKQILYLRAECPSDCSIKTLAFNLLAALDQAIGSNYLERLTLMRSISVSAIATQVKILCMTHNVGLILVDEIQNVILTAHRNRQIKPLVKFLVELTNETGTAVFFVGTPSAEDLFTSQEHLRRRTRGIRLLPLKPDGTYRMFLKELWPYQVTPAVAPLSEKLANKLYDSSGGIPAYVTKIFWESQAQALLHGQSKIDEKIMQRAIDILAIKIPKTFIGGVHISDFTFSSGDESTPEKSAVSPAAISAPESFAEMTAKEAPRLYANRRGRPIIERDATDLLVAFKTGKDMLKYLRSYDLLEVFQPC